MKSLLDVQIAKRAVLEEIENHNDQINVNIAMGITYAAQLVPLLTLQSVGGKKVTKKQVLEAAAGCLGHVIHLCNACNYDIPDEQELKDFEDCVPPSVVMDSVLSTMSIMAGLIDISHIINTETEGAIWSEEEMSDDFEDDMFSVIIGIKNLVSKFGLTMEDVIHEIV